MMFKVVGLLVASLALIACSKDAVNTPVSAIPDCVFADGSNQPAPDWVCGALLMAWLYRLLDIVKNPLQG
ncbi:hypothetical protein [Marinomonas rhodophyticola]|uniref:Lipoprotein n=1 Tax=Marinomonas rhodophyticola TaxID=2992803 RepID=A0ABT3KFH5_9GAMM|nr:hypothetical protein [Marinomonas sp. KJ51-3]MCW4629194.1 hypothetical protein [Marinomonas sp. KJ51-3]